MTLYLFTSSFPYGNIESFLEDEIKYLCKEFTTVEIFPFHNKSNTIRFVPSNCIVHIPICSNNKIYKYINGLFNSDTFFLYFSDFFKKRVYLNKNRLKSWIISYINANNLLNSSQIKSLFSKIEKNDICYSYWGKGSNILSIIYNGKARFVSRFHGEWDLWEESSGNYAPIREQEALCLDYAVFISQKGESYFLKKYPQCKTAIYPLGSNDYGLPTCIKDSTNSIQVVSCSTVYPLKRVDLIFEALNSLEIDRKIEWTHLGGGMSFNDLCNRVRSECRPHLSVKLIGMVSHDKVMDYYKEHQFDVFINVSTNEGIPVSIMEAASFDIPIIATNVGGTSEIVRPTVGLLLSENPTIEEICSAIIKVLNSSYNPRNFWKVHYSADVNYTKFALFLKQLIR